MAHDRAGSSRNFWTLPRLLVLLLIVVVTPSLVIQTIMLRQWIDTAAEKEQRLNLESARAVGAIFEGYVADVAGTLGATAEAIATFDPAVSQIERFLVGEALVYPTLSNVSVANVQGEIIASTVPGAAGQTVADRPYFQRALNAAQGQWVVSDLLTTRVTEKRSVVIARPIHRDGQAIGVVLAAISPERLARVSGSLRTVEGGVVVLFDRKGKLVYRHPEVEIDDALREAWRGPLLTAALAGREQVGETVSPVTGEPMISARVPTGELGWVAGAGRPVRLVNLRAWAAVREALAVNLALIASCVAGVVVARWIIRRDTAAVDSLIEHRGADGAMPRVRLREFGELAGALISANTARSEAEQALLASRANLENIFNSVHDAIFVHTPDGRILDVNEKMLQMYGVTRSEALSLTIADFSTHRQTPQLGEIWQDVMAGRPKLMDWTARNVKTDQTFDVEVFLRRIDYYGKPAILATVRDITARKRGEAQLAEREEKLRLFIEHSPVALAMFDRQMRYLHASRRWKQDLSLGEADLRGRSHYDVFPEIPQRWREIHQRALAGEVIHADEDRFDRADGSVQWLRWEVRPWYDAAGEGGGILIFTEEITARKQAENALRQSEARFRAVFEQAAVGIGRVRFDDARWIDVNDTFCRMLGYSREEMQATPWPQMTHPDDIELDLIPFRRMAAGEIGFYTVEKRFIHKDGHMVWARLTLSLVRDAEGKPDYEVAIIEDIGERKAAEKQLLESEQRFRDMADNISQLAWMADENGWTFWYNKRWYEYTGTTLQEMAGWGWRKVHHPDHVQRVVEKISRCFRTGEFWEDTFPLRSHSGEYRWFLSRAVPIRDETGKVVRWFGTSTDVTEQRAAADALQKARDELEERVSQRTAELQSRAEQLARLTSEMTLTEERERRRIATVLHDHLQQLLVGARMQLDMLARQGEPGQREDVDRVKRTVQDAIDASRSLTAELSPPILHDAGLVAGLHWLARWMNDKHGLRVHLDVAPDVRAEREDTRVIVFQSVRELLFNVVKHAGVDEAFVKLSMPDHQLQATVEDRGRGMEPTALQRIDDKHEGGFGLLSIRERMTMLGGSFDIQTEVGRGSRFTLTVPIQPPAPLPPVEEVRAEQLTPPTPPVARPTHPPGGRRPIRLLLADDHAVMRQGLATVLSQHDDLEIVGEAADGLDALEQARRLQPDVVLMDFSMPRMNGVEATRQIHQLLPDVKVIGLSMYEESERAEAMRSAGAWAYLSKTGQLHVLVETIRSAVNHSLEPASERHG